MIKYIIWLFDLVKGFDCEFDGRYYETREEAQAVIRACSFADEIKIKILEVITND